MYIAINYTDDRNYVSVYSVALDIKYNDEFKVQNIIADPLIPQILISRLKWFDRHPCPSKQITPRTAIISLKSGQSLNIPYPFRPNTPEWYIFWQQLQSPEIVSIKSIGEKITDKHLRHSLNL